MGEQQHSVVSVKSSADTDSQKRGYDFIRRHREKVKWAFFLWVCLVALVAWRCFATMDASAKERRYEVLVSMCDERARMLQDQFSVSVNHVHALAVLVSTFYFYKTPSAMDQETFAEYTARTAFERPLLSGVAYAQRVVNSDRENFEKQHGWTIKAMESGELSPSRDEYAPVIFTQETVSHIASLDMMSGEEDRENILRARATGKAVLTSPFRLLASHHLGVVLTFPVYKSILPANPTVDERIDATAGYIGGSFDIESLVKNLLGQLAGNEVIVVNVYDVTNSSDPLMMYGTLHQGGDMTPLHVSPIDFGDPFRKHQMICRYHQKAPTPWTAITTADLIFVIGILVGYILYAAINHIIKVDDDFLEMDGLKSKAIAADRAKSEFLATVSHEIRTPINGILGMLAMLLDTDLCSTQRDYAQTAQACGKALITLINEVLDRAKIEAGKLELETVPFDPRRILDDVLCLFSEKSRNKNIELAVFVSEKVPQLIMGDPGRFRQIITNLVGNSVKFTEKGHIFVQVHLADCMKARMNVKTKPLNGESIEALYLSNGCQFKTLSGYEIADYWNTGDILGHLVADQELKSDASKCMSLGIHNSEDVTLMVCVEDTGVGIPLHAQDRVFMPFMQADSSTSRNYGGTGIGLSISKCLVQLMGGQINFISQPHIGSTFSFTANFGQCKQNVDLKNTNGNDLPTHFRGLKAILVDSKPVRAAVTRYHFKRLGILLEASSSIRMAVALFGSNVSLASTNRTQPDMILVEKDTWISDEDQGCILQLLDLKRNGSTFSLPKIVLLATNINGFEFSKAKAAGFTDAVIMKPLRASMIAACLQQVLGLGKKRLQERGSSFLQTLLSGKKILVVDDNLVNRRVAAGALKKFGAEVVCVDSGKAALSLLQVPHKFDACFMDIQMPEMDGFVATRKIRQMESQENEQMNGGCNAEEIATSRKPRLPILAMTADVINATYEKCLESGMDGYVSKPFEEENLYQEVARFFKDRPSGDS